MGVHGLWKLLEPSGKPVPVETLENKVLAVDMSIWLHQLLKGYQDSRGNPVPNAHLLGLFHRVCKLLFYKIKPVFVFDGGVPQLKKQTIASRQQRKSKAEREADRLREHLIKNLAKHKALKHVLGDKGSNSSMSTSQKKKESDMFQLPVKTKNEEEDISGSSEDDSYAQHDYKVADLHAVDVNSEQFKSLPADVRHDILNELKETRKQSSWGKLHEMPKESGEFSNYQMTRLLKRRSIQISLDEAEKEMGGRSLSLGELQEMLTEQGVVSTMDVSKRIASDNVTRYLYFKEVVKQAKEEDIEKRNVKENAPNIQESTTFQLETESKNENSDVDFLELLEKELSLSSDAGNELQISGDFIYENSALTQKQILDLIKQQNISQKNKYVQVEPSTSKECTPVESIMSNCKLKGISEMKEVREVTEVQMLYKGANNVYPKISSIANMEVKTSTVHSPDNAKFPDSDFQRAINIEPVEVALVNTNMEQKLLCTNDMGLFQKQMEKHSNITEKSAPITKASGLGCKRDNSVEPFVQLSAASSDSVNVSSSAENRTVSVLPVADRERELNKDDNCSGEESSNESFVEVRNSVTDRVLQVVINPKESCGDDIFADIFSDEVCGIKNSEKCNLESKNSVGNESVENLTHRKEETKATVSNPPKPIEDVFSPISKGPLLEEMRKEFEDTEELDVHKSSEELQHLQANIEEEQKQLLSEKGKQDRLAATVSQQMQLEAQELLRLFGIPYIIAPMEAEAQCAFLDSALLTDGTITDDSDIWLFGGCRVYKNFFNQKKYVLQYTISQIQHCFKMSRHELVLLALLVGSDYTPGIQGIGPVTALEILAAFADTEDPLQTLNRFQNWWKAGMPVGSGHTSLRSKLQGIQLTEGFPSTTVVNAYLRPEVDESKETFSWGTPNLESLREYTRQKFGWTKSRTDEIMIPIINKLSKREELEHCHLQKVSDRQHQLRHHQPSQESEDVEEPSQKEKEPSQMKKPPQEEEPSQMKKPSQEEEPSLKPNDVNKQQNGQKVLERQKTFPNIIKIKKTKIRELISNLQHIIDEVSGVFQVNKGNTGPSIENQSTIFLSELNALGENNNNDDDDDDDVDDDICDTDSHAGYQMEDNQRFQYDFLNLNSLHPGRTQTVSCLHSCVVPPGRIAQIETGLKIQIPKGYSATVNNYKFLLHHEMTVLCDSKPHTLTVKVKNNSTTPYRITRGTSVALLTFNACHIPEKKCKLFETICCDECEIC